MVTWSESCFYIDLTRVSWRVKVKSFTQYLVRFPYPLATGHPQACQMWEPDYRIPRKKTREKSWPSPWWHWFPLSCEKWTRGTDGPNLSGVRSTKFICSHHIMSSGESNGNHSRFYIIMVILLMKFSLFFAVLWEQNIFRDNVLCISNWNSSNRGFGDSEFQAKRVVTVEGASV